MELRTSEYAARIQDRQAHFYRLAYCYVKHQQDALDIVSEAVYRGLLRLHQLRETEHFDAWMDRIVVHAALDHLRKHRHFKELGEELLPLLPAEEGVLTAKNNVMEELKN